jgi:hypothetical protein
MGLFFDFLFGAKKNTQRQRHPACKISAIAAPAAIVPSVAADIARRPALADRFRHLDRRRGVLAPRQLGAHRRTELLETRMANRMLLQPQIELEALGGGTQPA